MGVEELAGRLRSAAERMDGVKLGLIDASPERLEGCAGQLELACLDLTGVRPQAGGTHGKGEALAAVQQLRANIAQARRLLDNAWRFHERWGQMLGVQTGGYLAGGQAAPVFSASRVVLRG